MEKEMVQKYQIVLLDMDNTFLDSRGKGEIPNEWAYGAFEKSLRYYGITLTIAEMNNLFIAPLYYEGVEGVIKFCNTFGLDSEEFWARRERDIIEAKIEAIRSGLIKLCNGSEETIKYLNIIKRFHLAVVSDSQQACVDYTLEYLKLKQYFAVCGTGEIVN
ncbi:MAG: HAD hydrolase-like protein [Methanophagales archaeon]|nr:HAD hydrolase-like protein [Methanophagales archaeon]